jgi:hypothetical protein
MKLRMLDSSIRLRLSRWEVEAFGRGERIQSTARFPNGGVFVTVLSVTAGDVVTVRYEDDCLEVQVPRPTAAKWAGSEDTGIAAEQPTTGGMFGILIEKDFSCLHSREHDSAQELFPNPRAAHVGGPLPSTPME